MKKPTILDHLNPLKDMECAKALGGAEGVPTVAYRNLFRGAIYGALAGTALVGEWDFIALAAMGGAITDMTQGLGRGTIAISHGGFSK